MNKKILLIALVVVLSLGLFTVVNAQGGLTKSLSTNFTLLNFGTSDATVTASYKMPDGTEWTGYPTSATNFTIGADGGQAIFRQYDANDTGTAADGAGSLVISADQELGAVVQVLAPGQTPTSGAYSGFSGGASEFSVPLVMKNLTTADGQGSSQVIVQNITDSSVTVDIQLYDGSGSLSYTKSGVSIAAGASFVYDLSTESSTNLSDGFYGSASVVVQGVGEVVVVSNLFMGDDGMQTFNAFPATSATTDWFVPLATARLSNGLSTPIAVQNLSGATVNAGDITLDCGTFTITNTTSVSNRASYFFNPVVDTTNFPDAWYGSCTINATGSVVAFVQMRFVGQSGGAAAYEAIPAGGTDTTVQVPLVAKKLGNGFCTALTVQNLSSSNPATVTLTYAPSIDYVTGGGSSSSITIADQGISSGSSLIQNQCVGSTDTNGVAGMPDGWYGTVTVASSNQPIASFVQLRTPGAAGDPYMAHNGFTQP